MRLGEYWAVKVTWPRRRPVVTAWFQGFESDNNAEFATLKSRRFKFDTRDAAHLHARHIAADTPVTVRVVHVVVNKR